jgi:cysteinyl-tRNA synthetase
MMTLSLYNTLTRKKEPFVPIDATNVRMYVCGPTVYDFAHIGNARPVIVFDVLFRLLRHLYGKEHVTYVRNITDVDDKINARALRDFPNFPLNEAIRKVTEKTANQFDADVKALGNLEPTHQPRATEFISQMVDMISILISKGHAYVAGGEVLFDVTSMKDYGQLSNRKLEDQQAGARVAVDAHKKNPGDFVLWKLSSAEEPGWESPWGRGRPGWHIECSAMSKQYLGEVFDIHGGGLDLIFPHHENEIAQSRCAHGTSVMANVWMHNGFLQVEGQKMSKSLGNFFTIAEVLKDWPGEVTRFNMLRTHYRQPIDWTTKGLEEARRSWVAMGNAIRDHLPADDVDGVVLEELSDDLNTPAVFTRMSELLSQAASGNVESARKLRSSLEFLGFFGNFTLNLNITYSESDLDANPVKVVQGLKTSNGDYDLHYIANHFEGKFGDKAKATTELLRKFDKGTTIRDVRPVLGNLARLKELDSANTEARAAKNYASADAIRKDLSNHNLIIKINKDGTTSWEVKR